MQRLKQLSLYIFVGLLAYMPLHIFLSTWLGSSFGVLDFAKVFKDVVLIFGFLCALIVSWQKDWFKTLKRDRLNWLIAIYAGLTLLLALLKKTDTDAEILGIVFNLRFLLFFIYAQLIACLFDRRQVIRQSLKIILLVGLVTVLFGLVQYWFLPNQALAHVGYSRANGVLPAFFIDDKPNLERAMSTLRDPNSFGSYLVILLSLASGLWLIVKKAGSKLFLSGFFIAATLSLIFSFSRSAWLGAIVSLIWLAASSDRAKTIIENHKKALGLSLVTILCIVTLGIWVGRNSYWFKNTFWHADESTVLENPNQLRGRFWRETFKDIVHQPLGHGPGTAGLASIKNDHAVKLTENYYLQIGYEVGVLGLVLFLKILIFVAIKLQQLNQPLAAALVASFVGLALTNFLVHIWSNEAVAYTWWGLAGLVVSKKTN